MSLWNECVRVQGYVCVVYWKNVN